MCKTPDYYQQKPLFSFILCDVIDLFFCVSCFNFDYIFVRSVCRVSVLHLRKKNAEKNLFISKVSRMNGINERLAFFFSPAIKKGLFCSHVIYVNCVR